MVKFLSRAPMWALYAFSGLLYFLAYHVARHRRVVIREQLARVFPDMPESERIAIHKRFLKNFCDVLVEVLKSISIQPADMTARVRIANLRWRAFPRCRAVGAARDLAPGNWEWLLHGVRCNSVSRGCRLQADSA